jgi:hypothetical protein
MLCDMGIEKGVSKIRYLGKVWMGAWITHLGPGWVAISNFSIKVTLDSVSAHIFLLSRPGN